MSEKDFPPIKPTSDIFIAVFLSSPKNEPLLRSIINAVLEDKSGRKPIDEAIILNPFNITNFAVDKQIVLDVRVADRFGNAFNIEIQVHPHVAFRERILYGWSSSFSAQLPIGGSYRRLKPVITIVITEFAVFSKLPKVHLVFEVRERDNHELVLSEHFQVHIWQLHKVIKGEVDVLKDVPPNLAHWSQFLAFGAQKSEVEMAALTNNDPRIIEAYREFQQFTADPQTRELARQRHMFLVDYHMALDDSRIETLIETARNFKLLGIDSETIAKGTGLSLDEVEHLN
jgi:predicted transposase/invertase (TIGR01784 family)